MRKIIVPLNVFQSERVIEKGQEFFIPIISETGADGVEIRRELLTQNDYPLTRLKNIIMDYGLFIVYSAPIPLWKRCGALNDEELNSVIHEAKELGATLIKVSLGFYQPNRSDIHHLKQLLYENGNEIHLLVENDQTSCGGSIHHLLCFFKSASIYKLPVNMTFDIGNWKYSGENVYDALHQFYKFIKYVHLKHVEIDNGKWSTLPLPLDESAEWRRILDVLPQDLPVALEFPIENTQMIQRYISIFRKSEKKKGVNKWM